LKEALFYEKLSGNKVKCFLCPHKCVIGEGQTGACIVRRNIGGILYAETYNEITSIAVDPIEKKPLYHFYPGSRILSIGSNGCNMKCFFCQNWTISMQNTDRKRVNPEALKELCLLENSIGIAYTYNEPLIQYEFLRDMFKYISDAGLKNVLVSNGLIEIEPLDLILPTLDAANIDLKCFNEGFYKEMRGDLRTVKNTIISLIENEIHTEITILIIPDKNDNEDEFANMCNWIANLNVNIPLHISRYFPNYKSSIPPTSINTIKKLYDIGKSILRNVYVGNVIIDDTSSSFCHNCNKKLVDRQGYNTEVFIKENKCPYCGSSLYFQL
jgi:pyruvate formate lyase activating enzyme